MSFYWSVFLVGRVNKTLFSHHLLNVHQMVQEAVNSHERKQVSVETLSLVPFQLREISRLQETSLTNDAMEVCVLCHSVCTSSVKQPLSIASLRYICKRKNTANKSIIHNFDCCTNYHFQTNVSLTQ